MTEQVAPLAAVPGQAGPAITDEMLAAVRALEDQLEQLLGPRPAPPRAQIRNVNAVAAEQMTLGDRVADGVATTMGSWRFIIIQSCILLVWITLNVFGWIVRWDPYPFILRNLALSFEAAYAAPIIMMSQNRAADKDRLVAEIDHQVNVKAEVKTGQIMSRLDDMEREMHFLHAELLRHIRMHAPPTGNGAPAGDAAGR
jgi:uncharacterized membrane protein